MTEFDDKNYRISCSEKTLQTDNKGFFMDFVNLVKENVGQTWIQNKFGKLKDDNERIKCLYESDELVKLEKQVKCTPPLRLQGRIALVTGSTSGIGLSIAERLAQDGAKIIISSRNGSNVDAAVKNLSGKGYDVIGVPCHIGDKSQRENLIREVEKLGGLDIFVQNAAVNPTAAVGSILDCPEEAWDKIFDVNLKSNFLITKELLHLLKKSKCPRIVYIGSAAAFIGYEASGAYAVSKMALVSFTRMVSLHLGKYGITANCVAPGLIDTPFGGVLVKDQIARQQMNTMSAIKRMGRVEEVSGLVAFLASNESSYITGETMGITGGYYCRL